MHTDEPTQYKPVPLTGVTELRIHGVSGTPPSSMLDDPHPLQVWGDKTAGFYRGAGHTGDPPRPTDNLEAYSWGGLTAGSGTRALWLLLLPFMLVNVASWAHPPRRGAKDWRVGVMSGAIRVLALTLTLTLLLSVAFLTMDLIAWQCATRGPACASEHWYTRLFAARAPGTRVVLGALPVVVFVVLIRWLSHSTSRKYEAWRPEEEKGVPTDRADVPPGVWDMGHPSFWYGSGPLARLRALHVTACWVTLGGLVAYAAGSVGGAGRKNVATGFVVVAAVVVALIAAALASPLTGRRHELLGGHRPTGLKDAYCVAVRWAPYAGAAFLAAAAVFALVDPDGAQQAGALPGLHWTKNVVVVAQGTAFVLLVIGNVVARWRFPGETASTYGLLLNGFAATLLAAAGTMLAGSFAAGLTLRVADYLGCPEDCQEADNVAFVLPDVYENTARGFSVATAVAVVALLYVWLRVRTRLAARALPLIEDEYAPGGTDPQRRQQIAKIHATAALTDYGARPLAWILLGGALGAFPWPRVVGHLGFLESVPLVRELYDVPWARVGAALTTAGGWLVGAAALGLVALGHQAYRNESLRRTVGILWDLGTFWPRAAHPFAPPCYCERTVPEFARRIEQLRDSDPRRSAVVVSAHSQGTVIAVATLLRLRTEPGRLALLTYGSPLQRLYGRAFPHFFGLPVLRYVRHTYGSKWTNLYRRSDPIGGPVDCADADVPQQDGPDKRLPDPIFTKDAYAFDAPPPYGHSHYFADRAFDPCVAALAAKVRSG